MSAKVRAVLKVQETDDQQLDKGLAKRFEYVVDLDVELVGSEEWSPSSKNRMCNLEDADINFRVAL